MIDLVHLCPTCGYEVLQHHAATVTCPRPHAHKPHGTRTMKVQARTWLTEDDGDAHQRDTPGSQSGQEDP